MIYRVLIAPELVTYNLQTGAVMAARCTSGIPKGARFLNAGTDPDRWRVVWLIGMGLGIALFLAGLLIVRHECGKRGGVVVVGFWPPFACVQPR